jgi:hypothetical protein
VNELPATVPIAVTLAILEAGELRARRRSTRAIGRAVEGDPQRPPEAPA